MAKTKQQLQPQEEKFEWLDYVSDFLDSKYRIPGTDIRFGADFLIGLVPYVGDVSSFVLSGTLVLAMAKHGASGKVILKMLWNIIIDTLIGAIPILGDIFDLTYRANRRNFNLLREHHQQNQHQGSAWGAVFLVLLVLIGLFSLMVFLVLKIIGAFAGAIVVES